MQGSCDFSLKMSHIYIAVSWHYIYFIYYCFWMCGWILLELLDYLHDRSDAAEVMCVKCTQLAAGVNV